MVVKMIKFSVILNILMIISDSSVIAQNYLEREDLWVRSKLSEMTLDQKIGQIFIIRSFSRGNVNEDKVITDYIKNIILVVYVFSRVRQLNR